MEHLATVSPEEPVRFGPISGTPNGGKLWSSYMAAQEGARYISKGLQGEVYLGTVPVPEQGQAELREAYALLGQARTSMADLAETGQAPGTAGLVEVARQLQAGYDKIDAIAGQYQPGGA